MATYGLDLRELLWGRHPAGVRRLFALVSGLPADSALARSMGGRERWTQDNELLATIVDVLGVSNYMFAKANSKKNTNIPAPVHFPRPWENSPSDQSRVPSSPEEVRAFFMDPEFGTTIWDAHGAEETS